MVSFLSFTSCIIEIREVVVLWFKKTKSPAKLLPNTPQTLLNSFDSLRDELNTHGRLTVNIMEVNI